MELIVLGLIVWGVCAWVAAGSRKREEERERQRAEDERRQQAAAHQRWLNSLIGTTDDGLSRFRLVLDEYLHLGDWASISAMVDTLPDWPIRERIHQAMADALNLYKNIDLACAAGVHPATCRRILDGEVEHERVLWDILVNTAMVGQSAGRATPWRRLRRDVRRGIDEDRREIEEIIARIGEAYRSLQTSMAWRNRSGDRRAGRSLHDATRTADHITRTWRRPGR